MLCSLGSAGIRKKLEKVKIKLCNTIENHSYDECDLYTDKYHDLYHPEEYIGCEPNDAVIEMKLNNQQDIYCSSDVELFGNVMLYSIIGTVSEILKSNTACIVKNKFITKISLETEHEILFKLFVPKLKCEQAAIYDDWIWIEPIERQNVGLIKIVNSLVYMLKLARINKDTPKELVLSGHGEHKVRKAVPKKSV